MASAGAAVVFRDETSALVSGLGRPSRPIGVTENDWDIRGLTSLVGLAGLRLAFDELRWLRDVKLEIQRFLGSGIADFNNVLLRQ
jgi:hypothetical protein